ncbi:Fc.00g103990.m01.CDS01 [Cosmosporella sp. VM-42]
MSLVTELGIDNEPFSSTKISPGALNEISPNPKCQVERTLEERRCYLGVFWINSVLRTCAMDMTPMPSRQSIDRSCHILEQTGQFQSDSYLARLVRMQQVADTIDVTLYRDLASDKVNISATLLMAITYLERELESLEVKQSLVIPQHGKNPPQNGPFLSLVYSLNVEQQYY